MMMSFSLIACCDESFIVGLLGMFEDLSCVMVLVEVLIIRFQTVLYFFYWMDSRGFGYCILLISLFNTI